MLDSKEALPLGYVKILFKVNFHNQWLYLLVYLFSEYPDSHKHASHNSSKMGCKVFFLFTCPIKQQVPIIIGKALL